MSNQAPGHSNLFTAILPPYIFLMDLKGVALKTELSAKDPSVSPSIHNLPSSVTLLLSPSLSTPSSLPACTLVPFFLPCSLSLSPSPSPHSYQPYTIPALIPYHPTISPTPTFPEVDCAVVSLKTGLTDFLSHKHKRRTRITISMDTC